MLELSAIALPRPTSAGSQLREAAMEAIVIAGLWVVVSLVITLLAAQKGNNPVLWFLCSIALSPALGWMAARALEEARAAGVFVLTKCPYCGAAIAETAETCPRCHAEFPGGVPRRLAA
jgi:hypothetical protein